MSRNSNKRNAKTENGVPVKRARNATSSSSASHWNKVKQGVRGLTHELLTIEAQGNYHAAKTMLETLGVIRPSVQKALDRMAHIPVDIEPQFVTAEQLVPSIAAHF